MKIPKLLLLFTALLFINKARAQCTASFDYTINPDGSILLANTSTPSSQTIAVNYYWNIGSSTFTTTSLSQTVSIPYTGNGTYITQLSLQEANNSCLSDTFGIIQVTTSACPLTASFSTNNVDTVSTVNFTSIVTGTTNSTTYLWDLNDGATSTMANPTHIYTGNGIYIPTLTVSNSSTCYAVYGTKFSLETGLIVICSYTPTISYTIGANGLTTFTVHGQQETTNLAWRFGDCDACGTPGILNPSHIYFDGVYTPTLFTPNGISNWCPAWVVTTLTITNHPCNSDASFTYTSLANGAVSFSKTNPTADTNILYGWLFGDGFVSNLSNITHTYSSAGNYVVRLYSYHSDYPYFGTGTDTSFMRSPCETMSEINMNINNIPCVANANFNIGPGGYPQQYLITPDYPYNVINSTWDWGDGTSSTGFLFTFHTYSAAGSYDICLTVTTSCGAIDTSCVSQYFSKGTQGDMMYISVVPPAIQTGIPKNNIEEIHYSLFPNPSNDGIINLRLDKEAEIKELRVFDLVGKEVYFERSPGFAQQHSVNLNQLINGIYFIQFKLPGKTVSSKFIISRM